MSGNFSSVTLRGSGVGPSAASFGILVVYVLVSDLALDAFGLEASLSRLLHMANDGVAAVLAAIVFYRISRMRLDAVESARAEVRGIVDQMSDAFFAVDKAKRYVFLNARTAEFYGRSVGEMVGRPISEFVAPENVAPIHTMIDEVLASGKAQRHELKRSQTHFEVTAYPAGEGVSFFFQDISARRRAETLLHQKTKEQTALAKFSVEAFESEDFRALFERAVDVACDVLRADAAVIVRVDPARKIAELLAGKGWSKGVYEHKPALPLAEVPDRALLKYLLQTGEAVRFADAKAEQRFDPGLRGQGFTGGLAAIARGGAGSSIALSAYSRDAREFTGDDLEFLQMLGHLVGVITQRAVALETLRLRERALESITQGITITDETAPDAAIIYTNPAFALMTGFSENEIVGQRLRNFLAPDAAPGLNDQIALARAKGRALRYEATTRKKDGTTFFANVTASPIVGSDGSLTHYVAVHEDVTDSRLRDQKLIEAQKLETVGQLTGGIAHDFNNLLTVIKANAEDLRQDLPAGGLQNRQADLVLQAANRGAGLVQQLMAFARKQNLEPEVVDVNAMLAGFKRLVQRAVPENVEITIHNTAKVPAVLVDPSRLESALLNLSINARDAMPNGGRLLIETSVVTLDNDYERKNPDVKPGGYVLISVTDSGTGMPKEVVDKAFQPFFTTKEVGKGTGLGLSMVYGFVKQSGGHAKIYSEVGHGTTIKLFLPPAEAKAATAAPDAAKEETGPALSGKSVLLVEDDELVRQSVGNKLERLGFSITAVGSAAGAIEVLEKNAAFDLIFTDVIMPGGMSGADLAREVMRRWPAIKLLMTSGYTEASALGKVKMPDGVRLLSKPYANADLLKTIREVMDLRA